MVPRSFLNPEAGSVPTQTFVSGLALALAFLVGLAPPAWAEPLVIYRDADGDGRLGAGEEADAIVLGAAGTSSLHIDIPAGADPARAELTLTIVTADDVESVDINGISFAADFGTFSGNASGNFGSISAPWDANGNGLPRAVATVGEGGITAVQTTSSTGSAVLADAPLQGTAAAWSPSFRAGQNVLTITVRDGGGPDGVNARLSGSFEAEAVPPEVSILPAAEVFATSAVLGLSVGEGGGLPSGARIYYGLADGGTTPAAWGGSVAVEPGRGDATAEVSGLEPGSDYYFRAYASNAAGEGWAAASGTFVTPVPTAPAVGNAPATAVRSTSVHLGGAVVDHGADPPRVSVYYGRSDGGAVSGAWEGSAVVGAAVTGSFTVRVSGLEPSADYFFRAFAENAGGSAWAPASASFSTAAFVPLSVVINEVHYDPPDNTVPAEFIELFNAGDAAADLSGWVLEDGVDYSFPPGTTLEPGAYLVVAADPSTLQAEFGAAALGPWAGKLNNDGEQIQIRDADGALVDEVDYGAGFPWPTGARGGGGSMELIHPALDNDLGGSWRTAGLAPAGPRVTYVAPGGEWKFFRGRSEPPGGRSAWREADYLEGFEWESGPAPIGYDDGDDATVIEDMSGNYSSLYFRKTFTVPAGEVPARLAVRIYIDDGAIVWINGTEVGRFFVSAGDKAFDDFAQNHEAAWVEAVINNASNILRGGTNVIAVHGLNGTLGSSDFSFDAELRTPEPGEASGTPTPGAANSVWAENAPPATRQVGHGPQRPAGDEAVVVTAKVTDPDGVASVRLEYQVVEPGAYIRKTDAAFDQGWTALGMLDDGTGGDAAAGDDVFSATVPAAVQRHRRLVRYRLTVTDGAGASARLPYGDDGSPNFAYFVYGGAPAWAGAFAPGSTPVRTFPAELMDGGLPIYHLLAREGDVVASQYSSGSDGVRFPATLVYDGEVYDHIVFYNRGEVSTYRSGKNKWRFRFNRARSFRARDNYGRRYRTTWRVMNFNACASPWVPGNRGMAGLDEAVPHRLYQLAGTPSSNTHWVHFRVIDDAAEATADQFEGDLWGLYLAIEHPDGRFLDERGLPDGSTYKIQGGGNKKHQGATQPTGSSDWSSFDGDSGSRNTLQWWRDNFSTEAFYGFRAINRATGNVDLRDNANYYMYHHPDGRWHVMPWDLDMMYIAETHWSGVIRADACLGHAEIAMAFRNRCRELLDLLFADPSRTGGQAAQLVDELSRVVNPPGEELTFADLDAFLWNRHPMTAGDHRGQFFVTPKNDGRRGGSWVRTLPSADHEGFQQFIIDYMTDTDTDGSFSPGDGDQDGYGFNYLSQEAADAEVPSRPGLTYTGEDGFPVDGLRFRSGAFLDLRDPGSFGAMEWRVGEVYHAGSPGYVAGDPWRYEIEPVWESGVLESFDQELVLPLDALRPGRTYRARVRHRDDTGRWSHWSAPVEFLATGPDVGPLRDGLRVTEIMYHPAGEPAEEFIELQNVGPEELPLSGVRFTKGIDFDFPDGARLAAGAFTLVLRDRPAFEARYGPDLPIAGEWDSRDALSNGGEDLKLSFGAGTAIHEFTFDDDPPWPTGADGTGRSLVLRDPAASPATHELAASWVASAALGGSPGRAEPARESLDSWRAARFSAAELADEGISGSAADPDGDGVPNLLEYAFATGPKAHNGAAARTRPAVDGDAGDPDGRRLILRFRRRTDAGDLAYQVEFSPDLSTWSEAGAEELPAVPDPGGDPFETAAVRAPSPLVPGGRLFARLRVVRVE